MTALLDFEIEVHAYRLIQSGNYSDNVELLNALKEDFPNVDESRLRICCTRLFKRLLACN